MNKLTAILLGLSCLVSCRTEEPYATPPEEARRAITQKVSVSFTTGEETKSVASALVEDFSCAYLFAFWHNTKSICLHQGSGLPVALYTEEKTFDWSIPVGEGQRIDIWTLVNPAESLKPTLEEYISAGTSLSESDLEALNFTCRSPQELIALDADGTHMPMSGIEENLYLESPDTPLALTLKRLFSRYDIRINTTSFAQNGWSVKAARVAAAKSNTEAPYFYTGSGAGFRQTDESKLALADYATFRDLESINADDYASFYLLENCQGNLGPATSWDRVAHEIPAEDLACCTYLDIVVDAVKSGYHDRSFSYRLYLGQQTMKENFDVIRNRHKKLSLNLGSPTDGFEWKADGAQAVAPGELLELPFETTLEKDETVFQCLLDHVPSDELELVGRSWSSTSAGTFEGTATFLARADCEEGTVVLLQGGDSSGDVADRLAVTITEEASYFKDVKVLQEAAYAGQWSCLEIGPYVGKKDFEAWLYTFKADGSRCLGTQYNVGLYPQEGVDSFIGGKTGYDKSHLFYDSQTGRLFVYGSPFEGAWYELDFTIIAGETEDGEEISYLKRYYIRPKWPLIRGSTPTRGGRRVFYDQDTVLELDNVSFPSCDIEGVLLDPDSLEILPASGWGWASSFTGSGWQNDANEFVLDNSLFFRETHVAETYRASALSGQVDLEWNSSDPGSDSFEWARVSQKNRDVAYDSSLYFSFGHSLFGGGNRIYPVVHYTAPPPKKVIVLEANPGTSEYSRMSASAREASGNSFYLMPGLKQTYYVSYEGFVGDRAPTVSIEPGSEGLPFTLGNYPLSFQITKVDTRNENLYRIDFYTTWTYQPGTYDDSWHGYGAAQQDTQDYFCYNIRIHYEAPYMNVQEDHLQCKVLLQRMGYTFNYSSYREPADAKASRQAGGFLKMQMFNPLKFRFRTRLSATATTYLERQDGFFLSDMEEDPDSRSHFHSQCTREVVPDNTGVSIEGPAPENTINRACDLAWASKTVKYTFFDQILLNNHYYFYIHPIPKLLEIELEVDMPGGFSSATPGLSYSGAFDRKTAFERYCTAQFTLASEWGLRYKYFEEKEVWNDWLLGEPAKQNYNTWKEDHNYLAATPGDHLLLYGESDNWARWSFTDCAARVWINGTEDFLKNFARIGN